MHYSFQSVTAKDVLDVISTLDDTKSSGGDIPLRILKGNRIFPQVLCKWIKDSLKTGSFQDPLGRSNTYSWKGRSIWQRQLSAN